jgi:hypothetical protein
MQEQIEREKNVKFSIQHFAKINGTRMGINCKICLTQYKFFSNFRV